MTQIVLSNDLMEISAEINVYKQQAGQAVFEIGKRLKHVKENDIAHGQWSPWLESIEIEPRTAQRMIQAFEQFGNTTTSSLLPTGKIFEMLSLPETVDRQQFLEQPHMIPSTSETKLVDDMTVKELREVKKQLQDEQRKTQQAIAVAESLDKDLKHTRGRLNSELNRPLPQPQIVTKTVEVVPENVKKQLSDLEFQTRSLKAGYQEAKQKLQEYEVRSTDGYDAESAQKERDKMQHEADMSTINLRIAYKSFIEKAAVTQFLQGAIAFANPSEKERLAEMAESAQQIIDQTKLALKGRKLGVVT